MLYEKNADQQMPIASITKVMTLLLTFEAVHNGQLTMDTPVPVSEHAYHMGGSQIWLAARRAVHTGRNDQGDLRVLCGHMVKVHEVPEKSPFTRVWTIYIMKTYSG